MTLIVNGVDLVPYIVEEGYKVTRADGDSSDAGRTMDYTMHRARIATKFRIDVELKPLLTADAEKVLKAIMPEYVEVTYTNPWLGGTQITTMYSNNNVATIDMSFGDGKDRWNIDAIALVER